MANEGLRGSFNLLKITPFLLSRKWGIRFLNFLLKFSKGRNTTDLHCEERYIPSKSGRQNIRIRIFKPLDLNGKVPALLYYHGGGTVIGNPEMSLGIIKKFIETRPCVVIAPDYQKSLKAPFPAGFNNCYGTLLWVKENAEHLGVSDSGFIVAGHSAGGGFAAAVTLKARDTQDVKIAFQMPMYPMLDDRLLTKSARKMNVPALNSKALSKVWDFYLKGLRNKNEEVSKYAAPGRNNSYKNFPPTITFVGEYDPLRDETIAYVDALKKEGIPVVFKLFKGCFHGFEDLVPKSAIAKAANKFQFEAFAEYYDKFTSNNNS